MSGTNRCKIATLNCVRHHPLNTFGLKIATHPLSSSQPTPLRSPNPGESPQPPFSHDSSAQRRLEGNGVHPERLRPSVSRPHQQSHTSLEPQTRPKGTCTPTLLCSETNPAGLRQGNRLSPAAASAVALPGASVCGHTVPNQRARHLLEKRSHAETRGPLKQQWLQLPGSAPWPCSVPATPRDQGEAGSTLRPLPLLTREL